MYILEISHGKWDPAELEDKIVYHVQKWEPEKVGVEAVGAQRMIGFSLRNRLRKANLLTTVEDITQRGEKETKIRRLIPLYRNGQIFHRKDMCETLEQQCIKFPRGTHDDVIDATQMLYDLYSLQPAIRNKYGKFRVMHDEYGRPVAINSLQ